MIWRETRDSAASLSAKNEGEESIFEVCWRDSGIRRGQAARRVLVLDQATSRIERIQGDREREDHSAEISSRVFSTCF